MTAASTSPGLQLNQVSIRRGSVWALREVSLAIPAGLVTAVIGPSGAGKTTLLAALNGLLKPDSGEIRLTGPGRLDTEADWQGFRRQTATVFQDHALIGRLSVLDNVLLGLADLRHPLSPLPWSKALRLRAATALAEVGLLQRANQRCDRLSGGERQRVGMARAMVRQPKLLLGDEPFASVDPGLARQIAAMLKDMATKSGVTVVLSLHQIDLALTLADQIVAIKQGRLVYAGSVTNFDAARQTRLFQNPSVIRAEPPMTEPFTLSPGVVECSA